MTPMASASRRAAITANGIRATRLPPAPARRIFSARSIRPTAAIRSVTACRPNGIATDGNSETKITAYGFYYDLDLFSDFTYFLTDPNRGDQFEQQDQRWVAGLDARHTLFNQWLGRDVENTFGLQVRNDWIDNGLYQTEDRVRVDKMDSATGTILPADTEVDDFTDTQVGF